MRNDRLLILCMACVAAVIAIFAPRASAAPLAVSLGDAGRYPARVLVVSAPADHPLSALTLHIEENGTAVRDISVTPLATAQQGDFGVILAIDTSLSMRGEPLNQALRAAQTLAAERTGNQELGVVEFNRSISTTLPLTSDAAKISAALAHTPKVALGTRIYDAALEAIQQLHGAGVAAGTVIVLSDGGEYGTDSTRQAVAAAATADHVRVYTVGVEDGAFTPTFLRALANTTGGGYTASSAYGLREVFMSIESQLTSRYVVRYRSLQGLGRRVQLKVSANGIPGTWNGSYSSPPPPAGSRVAAVARRPPKRSVWASTLALVLVALVSAVLLVGGVLLHLVPRARQRDLQLRIGEFTRNGQRAETADLTAKPPVARERLDKWLSRFAWWPRFELEVSVAAIERPAVEVLALIVAGTLSLGILFAMLVGTPLVILPALMIGPVLVSGFVRARANRQRRAFAEQLPGHLEEIGSAIRAGHSVAAAIASVVGDATDPTRRELESAVTDERLGVPLDAALRPIAHRMRSTDIDQLALVATLNQRTGGNMAEVLDIIVAGARERADLRRELRALTAQARMSRWIVSALPPAVVALLWLVDPSYLAPLFHTTAGVIALCIATALVVVGGFVMRLLVPMED